MGTLKNYMHLRGLAALGRFSAILQKGTFFFFFTSILLYYMKSVYSKRKEREQIFLFIE